LSYSAFQKVTFDKAVGIYIKSGLILEMSRIIIGAYVDVSNNAQHGIVVRNGSTLRFSGLVSGTANTGYGVLVNDGSKVILDSISYPTITGTLGDVAIAGLTPGVVPTVAT
jgi:hypothetical protein